MLRFSDSGNTPKVKADEDLNSSVSWEPVIPFTIKQMGPEEGACAAWRDREGPLASHIGLVRKRMAFEAVSYTHLTLPTIRYVCRSRWSPYH